MKIVIFTGGTGSIALQRGLFDFVESNLDGIDIKIIVNAYDNGLSTGAVRRVMSGRILGPSDVRKNQTTRLRLTNPRDPWLQFLDLRFTASAQDAFTFCRARTEALLKELESEGRDVHFGATLLDAINIYFSEPVASQIPYDDFSLANVIYAGLAHANGDSLRNAARIMADAMRIPDNVILNDDRSLFLGAITRSGQRVTDEGDIVAWGNESDPFTDIFFVDADGKERLPELSFEAWQAIVEADLIILSSGTQWSSLIPTYVSRGFKSAIRDSHAQIVMVMNRTPDKDSPSQTASDIIDILVPRFFDAGRLHVITDENSHSRMQQLNQAALLKVASFTKRTLSTPSDKPEKHDAGKLAEAIGYAYFKQYVDSHFFLFDYDDTLCGRENGYPKSSRFNVEGIARLNALTNVGICSGNTIAALKLTADIAGNESTDKPLLVFADGGVNEYAYDTRAPEGDALPNIVRCVLPEALLPTTGQHSANNIVDTLIRAGVPGVKVHNRGNAVIAIRPIAREHRRAVMSLARNLVYGSDLEVRECGRSTVEIRKPALSKVWALKQLCAEVNPPTITYVGDECDSGNDHDIYKYASERPGLKCLHVAGPPKTAFFIATLLAHFRNHAKR